MPDFTNPIQRRPAGRAIRRTADQRERAAQIDAKAITDGRMLWMETAPMGWQGLVEAKVQPESEGR